MTTFLHAIAPPLLRQPQLEQFVANPGSFRNCRTAVTQISQHLSPRVSSFDVSHGSRLVPSFLLKVPELAPDL
jgi:hypothetical protein